MIRAPWPLRALLFVCLWAAASGSTAAQASLTFRSARAADGSYLLECDAAGEILAERGLWRWRSDGGSWEQLEADPGFLRLPAPAEWLEVELQVEAESGMRSARVLLRPQAPRPRAQRGGVRREAAKRAASLSGRALYRDRKFDLGGYTGMGRLPIRWQQLELRRASDDSLLARGSTDGAGYFSFPLSSGPALDLRIDLLSTIDEPGISLQLRDYAGNELRDSLAEISAVEPDSMTDLGEILLLDAEAANVLDNALDVVDFLADPGQLGALPDSGSVPLLRFDPLSVSGQTVFDGSEILISSAASGDSDGWSDCLILAALGQWAMQQYGGLDQWGAPVPVDLDQDLRRAFGDGAAMAFAAAVRQHRATTRFDADALPVDAAVHAFVDLPTAPPLGVPVAPEWGLDLELRLLDGVPVAPRGQLGAFNVACMLHDMADDPSARDGISGDDDPLAGDAARWFRTVVLDLAPFAGNEWIRFELAHDAWLQRYGNAAELAAIAVTTGRSALFDDLSEPDDSAATATALPLWVQPALTPGVGLRLNEIMLGAVDAVELFNPSDQPLDASGYRIVTYRNGFAQTASRTTTLPAGTVIGPGRCLVVHESSVPSQTVTDLYAAGWSVPWRHDEDGACTLETPAALAIDFLRWSGMGGTDPSATPVPVGTEFAGVLVAPQLEPATLGRDVLGADQDQASDFQVLSPTPRTPNVQGTALRSIRPRSESDWFRFDSPGSVQIVQLHAFDPRDRAMPQLAEVDSSGAALATGFTLGSESWIELALEPSLQQFVRLQQSAGSPSSAAWQLLAWLPHSDFSLLPVEALQARAQLVDPANDVVFVEWSNRGSYGGLRLELDGAPLLTLAGGAESAWIPVPAGRHEIRLTPLLGTQEGVSRTTTVFVGTTDCEARSDFEALPDIELFEYDGFSASGEGHLSNNALRDGSNGLPYADADEATALLIEPVDLTSDARLAFVHHCHVLDDGDFAAIEISVDDGQSWTELARYDASDHVGGGDPADWTDGVLSPGDWVAEQIALGSYAGQRARLRFRRVSNATGNSIGWGIDAIRFGSTHDGVWIDPAGSDDFGCGHRERPFLSALPAWNAVGVGDTIHLAPGLHQTPSWIQIDGQMRSVLMPLRPQAVVAGADSTYLDGAEFGIYVEASAGDSVVVRNLALRSATVGLRNDAATVLGFGLDVRGFSVGVDLRGGAVELQSSVLAEGSDAARVSGGQLALVHCTVARIATGIEASDAASLLSALHCIFAQATGPFVRAVAPASPTTSFICNDFWDSPTPFENVYDWIGWAGNVDLPVIFCDPENGDFQLAESAPQLDLLGCGAVGAFGIGCFAPAAVEQLPQAPVAFLRSAPNPFNPRVLIDFQLPQAQWCELTIYDARGRRVRTLLAEPLAAGAHRSSWDGRDVAGNEVASGVYRLTLRSGALRLTRSLVLLR